MYINLAYFPHAIPSSSICSTLAVGVFLFIEKESEIPRTFVKPFGVLNIGLFISTAFHILVGSIGFVAHGVNAKYPQFLFEGYKAGIALIMGNAFATIITFAIHGYCVVNILWSELFHKFITKKSDFDFYEMILRFIICVIVCEHFFIYLKTS